MLIRNLHRSWHGHQNHTYSSFPTCRHNLIDTMTRFDVIMTSYYCNYPKFDDILLQRCNTLYNGKVIERWTEGCILPFPKKGDLGLAKNWRGITLTPFAPKIYNSLPPTEYSSKYRMCSGENKTDFVKNRSTVGQIRTVWRISRAWE